MARAFRQQIDEGILDRAAALFARHGYTQTSVQAVADAVGLSKAGLLHYFPSKEALREAVVFRTQALEQEVLDQVCDLPPGPRRDRLALEALLDQALARPGLVALALTFVAALDTDALSIEPTGDSRKVIEAFGDGPAPEPERLLRITGALAALSILVLITHQAGKTSAWRSHLLATSFDALGHPPTAAR